MTRTQPTTRDLHAEITNQLIAAIEVGPGDFQMPWNSAAGPSAMPTNVETGNAYNGVNVINLWVVAVLRGYTLPIWGTYRQWQNVGAQVRGGEKSSLIVFYKQFETEPDDDEDDGKRRVARASCVFNAAQVDGYEPPVMVQPGLWERIGNADQLVDATGAQIREGGSRAFFDPRSDHIQMPDRDRFFEGETLTWAQAWYGVLMHELVHWSGGKSRLARDMAGRFGDACYAAEELIAEIGAAFLCSELQITPEVRKDHASYIASWLKLLKDDKKAVFTAAARASEAVSYLKGLQAKRLVA